MHTDHRWGDGAHTDHTQPVWFSVFGSQALLLHYGLDLLACSQMFKKWPSEEKCLCADAELGSDLESVLVYLISANQM